MSNRILQNINGEFATVHFFSRKSAKDIAKEKILNLKNYINCWYLLNKEG